MLLSGQMLALFLDIRKDSLLLFIVFSNGKLCLSEPSGISL